MPTITGTLTINTNSRLNGTLLAKIGVLPNVLAEATRFLRFERGLKNQDFIFVIGSTKPLEPGSPTLAIFITDAGLAADAEALRAVAATKRKAKKKPKQTKSAAAKSAATKSAAAKSGKAKTAKKSTAKKAAAKKATSKKPASKKPASKKAGAKKVAAKKPATKKSKKTARK